MNRVKVGLLLAAFGIVLLTETPAQDAEPKKSRNPLSRIFGAREEDSSEETNRGGESSPTEGTMLAPTQTVNPFSPPVQILVPPNEGKEPTRPKPVKPKTRADTVSVASRETLLQLADEATSTVGSFLESSNKGHYSNAGQYLTPPLQKYFDSALCAAALDLSQVLDRITMNGTISSVTFTGTRVRGEGARVGTVMQYESGAKLTHAFPLARYADQWCIIVDPLGSLDNAPEAATPAAKATNGTVAEVVSTSTKAAAQPPPIPWTKQTLEPLPPESKAAKADTAATTASAGK